MKAARPQYLCCVAQSPDAFWISKVARPDRQRRLHSILELRTCCHVQSQAFADAVLRPIKPTS